MHFAFVKVRSIPVGFGDVGVFVSWQAFGTALALVLVQTLDTARLLNVPVADALLQIRLGDCDRRIFVKHKCLLLIHWVVRLLHVQVYLLFYFVFYLGWLYLFVLLAHHWS